MSKGPHTERESVRVREIDREIKKERECVRERREKREKKMCLCITMCVFARD